MGPKDGSAALAWLSQGSTRWMLAFSLCWGASSCSSDKPESEEPVAKSQSESDNFSSDNGEFASSEGSTQDQSPEYLGSLTDGEKPAPGGEDSLEKTFASLSSPESSEETPPSDESSSHPGNEPKAQVSTSIGQPKSPGTLGSTPSSTYVVAGGDSLTKIAKKIFGQTRYWEEIAALNGLNTPYTIFPGQGLRFPLSTPQAKAFADAYRKNQKSITVQKGDSLSKLAAKVFGNQDSWRRLFNYNKDKIMNPNVLPAGITLAYFDGAGEVSVEVKAVEAPKVEAAPVPSPAPAAPSVPKPAPTPQVREALKAKVAPSVKTAKKAKQTPPANKKGSSKAEKSNIKISPSDLFSP